MPIWDQIVSYFSATSSTILSQKKDLSFFEG